MGKKPQNQDFLPTQQTLPKSILTLAPIIAYLFSGSSYVSPNVSTVTSFIL